MLRGLIPALLIGLAAAVAVAVFTWPEQAGQRTPQSASRPAIGGPFTLTDHTGKTVHYRDFEGKPTLVFFGYTFCPDFCPTSLAAISEALNQLGDDANEVNVLFVSVDPKRDTVARMNEYVHAFHPRITGLTGSKEQIDKAVKAFKIYYAIQPPQDAAEPDVYLVDHSTFTYLMDEDGRYITHFSHGTAPDKIAAAVRERL